LITEGVLCEICSSRPAKVVLLRRRFEDINRTFVCSECAGERTRLYAGSDLDFKSILSRMDKDNSEDASSAYSCKHCGTTLASIVVDGMPGCCFCYTRFAGEIEQAVHTVQDAEFHLGKAPTR